MKYRLFTSIENICDEIERMEAFERDKREDRTVVSQFFHGAPPYSQEQADALGLTVNVNNLFGFEQLTAGKDQLLALYTTPARLFDIELQFAPANVKKAWESKASAEWNRIMKKSDRLKMHYEFVAGDATMHGEGLFWNPSETDWCPKHCSLARRLVPEGATMDVAELTHFAVVAPLAFKDLVRIYEAGAENWDMGNVKALIGKIFEKDDFAGRNPDARAAVDRANIELLEQFRQASPRHDRAWSYNVPVVHFYQVNYDSKGYTLAHTILAKDGIADANKDAKANAVLYECDDIGITMTQTLFPLHMSCVVGGEPLPLYGSVVIYIVSVVTYT